MQVVRKGEGLLRRPPAPNAPTITVIFGGEEGGPELGLAHVLVPVGARMAPHVHGGSDVIITTVRGRVQITTEATVVDLPEGDHVWIGKTEAVGLTNPTDEPAEFLVAAAPPNFIAGIRNMPVAK